MNPMDVDAEVKRCVQVMLRDPDAGFDDLGQTLVAGGVTEIEAEALMALVPIGFAHAALPSLGVELPSSFLVRDTDTGETLEAILADDPIFQASGRLARSMFTDPASRKDAARILATSSEWATVRSLCPDGNDYSDCVLTETVLTRVPLSYLRKG